MATLVPSLVRCFREINTRWPFRDKWSDGWLGDSRHAAGFSDHNPDSRGRVHAIDVDSTISHVMGSGIVGAEVTRTLLRLARSGKPHPIYYLIYNGVIYSRTYGFRARRYTGDAHTSHVHLSVMRTDYARNWNGAWGFLLPEINASKVAYAFEGHPLASPTDVRRVQKRLHDLGYLKWPYVIGRAGPWTRAAVRHWQGKHGYKITGVPTYPQLQKIAGTVYRVVL